MKSSKKLSDQNVVTRTVSSDINKEGSVDFRSLKEPEKTLKRIEWIVRNQDFTHGEHAAATLVLLQFSGKEDKQSLKISELLSDENGYSSTVRRTLFGKMEKLNLIKRETLRGKGTVVELLF